MKYSKKLLVKKRAKKEEQKNNKKKNKQQEGRLPITILIVNGLNTLITVRVLKGKSEELTICCVQRMHFHYKDTDRKERKGKKYMQILNIRKLAWLYYYQSRLPDKEYY